VSPIPRSQYEGTSWLTRDHPARRWTTESQDKVGVYGTALDQIDAASNDRRVATTLALLLDTLPWRLAP